jgi:hypothetical protein
MLGHAVICDFRVQFSLLYLTSGLHDTLPTNIEPRALDACRKVVQKSTAPALKSAMLETFYDVRAPFTQTIQ